MPNLKSLFTLGNLFVFVSFGAFFISTTHASAGVCDAIKSVWGATISSVIPPGYRQMSSFIPYDPPIFGEGCNSGLTFSKAIGEPTISIRLQIFAKASAKSAQMKLGSDYDASKASNPNIISSIGDIGGFSASWRKNTYNNGYIAATKGEYHLVVSVESELSQGIVSQMTGRLITPLYNALAASPAGRETSFPPRSAPSVSQDNCPSASVELFGIPSSNSNCPSGSNNTVASTPQATPPSSSDASRNGNSSSSEEEYQPLSLADTQGTDFEDFTTRFYKVEVPAGRELIIYTEPTRSRAEIGRIANGTKDLRIVEMTKSIGHIWALLCHKRDCGYVVASHLRNQQSNRPDTFASTGESDVAVYMQPSVHEELVKILPYGFRVSVWEYADNLDGNWIYVCQERKTWCGWAEQDRFFRED